jgi:hypothetical protein
MHYRALISYPEITTLWLQTGLAGTAHRAHRIWEYNPSTFSQRGDGDGAGRESAYRKAERVSGLFHSMDIVLEDVWGLLLQLWAPVLGCSVLPCWTSLLVWIVSLVDALGLSIYEIMSSINRGSFASFVWIWMPFVLFSCLAALAKMSGTMLTRGGQNEHLDLVLGLWEALHLSPLSVRLAVTFT